MLSRPFAFLLVVSSFGCSNTQSPENASTSDDPPTGPGGTSSTPTSNPTTNEGGSAGTTASPTDLNKPDIDWGECGWSEEKTAVSLTYDDAMPTQIRTAVPALDAHKLRGTFFITDVRANPAPWTALLEEGHELAAHTFNHPCPGSNSWVPEGNSNEDYDLERMATELDEGLQMLQELGQTAPYTFAYPCGETYVGEERTSYIPLIEERFLAARGVMGATAGRAPDFYNVPSYFLKSTADALITSLSQATQDKSWIVFGFHGVGGDWETIPEEAHEELLQYLSDRPDEFYVAPFGEIASCLVD